MFLFFLLIGLFLQTCSLEASDNQNDLEELRNQLKIANQELALTRRQLEVEQSLCMGLKDLKDKVYDIAAMVKYDVCGSVTPNLRAAVTLFGIDKVRESIACGGMAQLTARDSSGRTALMLALLKPFTDDKPEFLMNIMTKDAMNLRDNDGLTALMYAIENRVRPEEMVEKLLEHGASPDVQDNNGKTALMRAIRAEECKVVESLLEHNASTTIVDKGAGYSALMHAIRQTRPKCEAIVEQILAKDPSAISVTTKDGMTPLMYATWNLDNIALAALLRYNASVDEVNNSGDSAAISALRSENVGALEMLLSHNASTDIRDEKGRTMLMLAARNPRFNSQLKTIINQSKSDIANLSDEEGMTALMHAIQEYNTEGMKTLLNYSNIDAQDNEGRTALMYSASVGIDFVNQLLGSNASVDITDNNGTTALVYSFREGCSSDNLEIVKLLLKANPDSINHSNTRGETPVMTFAKSCFHPPIEYFELLLDNPKANVTARDNFDRTLLMIALEAKNLAIFEKLLSMDKIDLHATDKNGTTALMYAADIWRQPHISTQILDAGADINAQDRRGQTAIMINAKNWDIDTTHVLIFERGADLSIRDNDGKTALMHAVETGYDVVVRDLLATLQFEGILDKDKVGVEQALKFLSEKNYKGVCKDKKTSTDISSFLLLDEFLSKPENMDQASDEARAIASDIATFAKTNCM